MHPMSACSQIADFFLPLQFRSRTNSTYRMICAFYLAVNYGFKMAERTGGQGIDVFLEIPREIWFFHFNFIVDEIVIGAKNEQRVKLISTV